MDDPNNLSDLQAAWARLAKKHSVIATEEVEADLRAFGIDLPKKIVRRNKASLKTAKFVVAGFYSLNQPPHYTDNIIGRCSCGRWIQWRPHAPALLTKLCLFCASYLD